jgi:hypothetical protein
MRFLGKWFEFVFVLLLRAIAGAVGGGMLGFCINWVHFVKARGGLANWPWGNLTWYCVAGAILVMLFTPREQRPWNTD